MDVSGAIIRRLGCDTKLWNNGYALSTYGSVDRRALLLMDNFSAHLVALEKAPPPSNIRIVFFPANATSIYQPLDQGIIQNLKHYYRKSWMYWMIGMLDRGIDPRERMSLNYTAVVNASVANKGQQ